MSYRIGLTGGIGSGKSRVSDVFAKLGIEVIDSDQIARQLVAPGQPKLLELKQAFGPDIFDSRGQLDRAALRTLVFSNNTARQRLESILHPLICDELSEKAHRAASPYVILVIPLLIESGWQSMVDRILLVDCSPQTQIQRVMSRDGFTEAFTRDIMATQASRERRLMEADDIISNEEGDDLTLQVLKLDAEYRRAATNSCDAST